MWNTSYDAVSYTKPTTTRDASPKTTPRRMTPAQSATRKEGDLIALMENHITTLDTITDEMLQFNERDGRILIRYPLNDRSFDVYIGMPFTKGVTERGTGRTELLVGTKEHHIDAMIGQFDGAAYGEPHRYGDCVRWFNVGTLNQGFLGLEYNKTTTPEGGVARTGEDVRFLASTLLRYGFDPRKRVFLLTPPYVRESEAGKRLRQSGSKTLEDYAKVRLDHPAWSL